MKFKSAKTCFSLAALFAAATAFANASSIQFVGVPTGVNDGNYYVLPYEITIDGTPQLVTCYDVYDDVNFGDAWQAQLLDLSQVALSGYFSTATNALAGYERVAWLDAQTYSNPEEQVGLQYAIWDVFGTYRSNAESQSYAAAADVEAAGGYQGFDFSGVRFVEQIGGSPGKSGTEQAFVYWGQPGASPSYASGAVPEPGTMLLSVLGAVFIAGFAGSRRIRRFHASRTVTIKSQRALSRATT